MFERTIQFILLLLAVAALFVLGLALWPNVLLHGWSVAADASESLVTPVLFAVTICWLWRYWTQPPQEQWSKRRAAAAAIIVAFGVHAVTYSVLMVLLFGLLGFEYSLGGAPQDGMAIAIGLYIVPQGLSLLLSIHTYRRLRSLKPPRHCRNCGYNLTGNESGVCPECGTSLSGDGDR